MDKIKYKLTHIFDRSQPTITLLLIIVCIFAWILQFIFPNFMYGYLAFTPVLAHDHPWTFLTTGFLHSTDTLSFLPGVPDFFHILFNMYSLYIVGSILEPLLGRIRFAILYFVSLLFSTIAFFVIMINSGSFFDWYTSAIGASGAIFGLFGALIIIFKRIGANLTPLITVLAINLLLPLLVPNVAWQAHIGGLISGIIVSAIMVYVIPRRPRHFSRRAKIINATTDADSE
ncbi:MAG: rhomboid family intramembrane serine protease [Bifidobacteriaceae bacterium]|jgi:membrane associated rhomboid family serine protease|nr:rhomboid family intramembrane serine protease [Bifidobacteriaceae bacterium]